MTHAVPSQELVTLLEPVIPHLRRYARALMRDGAAADDLVQDCLVRAIEHWHQRQRDGNVRAWAFSILHNLAMSQLRRHSRAPVCVPLDKITDQDVSTAARQEHSLRHRDLVRALEHLPEDHRSVLLLIGVEDLSYAEAAQVLGVPIGTVMSRLSRARERLAFLMSRGVDARAQRDDAVPPNSFLRRVK